MNVPELSVIIPTYNRVDRLKQVLAALERQIVLPDQFEVVVVSDGSTDGTDEYLRMARTSLRLRPVFQPNRGVAAARNVGVARATGDMVLFLDDDVVPAPQLIAEHLRVHAAPGGDIVVLGPMLTPPGFQMQPWVRWEQAMLMKHYTAMQRRCWAPTARQFYTGNASLARRHILDAGGFDESFRRAEDVELAYRLADRGLRFVFQPTAVGYHYAERSFQSWLMTPYIYGRNDVVFTQRKGQLWLLPTVFAEFYERHPLIQRLVRGCLGRPRASAQALAGMRLLATAGDRMGLEGLSRWAYSGMFNLRHYQGVADELGGREVFLRAVARAAPETTPAAAR